MALVDEVTSRYPAARLKQLTNPNNQAASTVNATILALAATDVEGEFPMYCAVTYDGTDARHVAVAVEGVIAKLAMRSEAAGDGANKLHDQWIDRMKALARVTGRNRIKPRTLSPLTPSDEQEDAETVRPDTDRPNFEDLIPEAPD